MTDARRPHAAARSPTRRATRGGLDAAGTRRRWGSSRSPRSSRPWRPSWVHVDSLANGFYLALAATGLWLAVGARRDAVARPGRVHGDRRVHRRAAHREGGLARAAGDARRRCRGRRWQASLRRSASCGCGRVFVAVTTWILAWRVALFLARVPARSRAARRALVVPPALSRRRRTTSSRSRCSSSRCSSRRRSRAAGRGSSFAPRGSVPAAAAALGVATARRRLGAFVASAAIGGLAGALAVQLPGVADAGEYGPYLSFKLFVAVLLGGVAVRARAGGGHRRPRARHRRRRTGSARLEGVARRASTRCSLRCSCSPCSRSAATGSCRGCARLRRAAAEPPVGRRRRARRRAGGAPSSGPPILVADGADEALRRGRRGRRRLARARARPRCCALDRAERLGEDDGAAAPRRHATVPTAGRVARRRRARRATPPRERAARGVVRTLQPTAAFGDLTALENVLVGAGAAPAYGGALRTRAATPLAERRTRALRAAARECARRASGSPGRRTCAAGELSGPEQRLARASPPRSRRSRGSCCSTSPRPAASLEDVRRLAALLARLREQGLAILLVEHNLRLVRDVAIRVVVLAAGEVIAAGAPAEVAARRGGASGLSRQGRL